MHTSLNIKNFDFHSFMKEHFSDFVVIVSGHWFIETHTGSFEYQTRFEGKRTNTRTQDLDELRSSNRAMLQAALTACQRIQLHDRNVFVLSPTSLGFAKGERSKGPNADLVNDILSICREKNLTLNSVSLAGGGIAIKDILANKM